MATAEDSDSPVAMKLKKMWLKTPVSEEQAAQAVLDPAIGNYSLFWYTHFFSIALCCKYSCNMGSLRIYVYDDGERDEPRGHEEMILRRTTITVFCCSIFSFTPFAFYIAIYVGAEFLLLYLWELLKMLCTRKKAAAAAKE